MAEIDLASVPQGNGVFFGAFQNRPRHRRPDNVLRNVLSLIIRNYLTVTYENTSRKLFPTIYIGLSTSPTGFMPPTRHRTL